MSKLHRKPLILFAIQTCIILSSCGPTGFADGGFKARGVLVSKTGAPPTNCVIRLYSYPKGQLLAEAKIPPTFEESFIIEPRKREYVMELQCAETAPWKSKPYELGDRKWYLEPLDLGTIVLAETNQGEPAKQRN